MRVKSSLTDKQDIVSESLQRTSSEIVFFFFWFYNDNCEDEEDVSRERWCERLTLSPGWLCTHRRRPVCCRLAGEKKNAAVAARVKRR